MNLQLSKKADPFLSQGAQIRGWWWLTCGATCPCWTTGTWFQGWQWPAADTAAWYTTASSTPSEAWACWETWTMWRGRGHWHLECQMEKSCLEFYSYLRADECWPVQTRWINIHTARQKTRQMVGLVLVWCSILQRRDGFPARAKVAEEWGLFNAHSCDGCGCVGTNFLGNVGFALREKRRARFLSSLCLKVVKCVFGVSFLALADSLHRKPSCAEYITESLKVWWILCAPLVLAVFIFPKNPFLVLFATL